MAVEVRDTFGYEKKVSIEVILTCNHYDYNPTKLAKLQHRENFFIHDIETYADEKTVKLYLKILDFILHQ